MPPLRHTTEQILPKLCEVKVALTMGQSVAHVSRLLRITEQAYNRWRSKYGGLKVDLIKRVKDPEWEDIRLKQPFADHLAKNS